jgi:tryptophan synthase alpha chain
MTSIKQAFDDALRAGGPAFIPFMTAGFPTPGVFPELITALDASADVIEVGLPFSDPLADGPVIQAASTRSLENGTTPAGVLGLLQEMTPDLKSPVVVMTYYNPVHRMGLRVFAEKARDAGVKGVIIPDLPIEEADPWLSAAAASDLDAILMVAPTTPPARKKTIAEAGSGFLYYVALTGVTGAALEVDQGLLSDLSALRAVSPIPTAVGFGVKGPESARRLSGAADGVIVGSALVQKVLDKIDQPHAAANDAAELAASIKAALRLEEAS